MSDPVVVFDGVQRWFGAEPVLRGLSFRVEPGQVYALLGRNGAGKTTALRILLGFLAPNAGRATVLGQDSEALGPRHRARIAWVSEEHRLYPTMTVGGALAFEAGTRPGFRTTFAEHALQRCGLKRGQWVRRLSRGQRAQLCLVLAVAGAPELLVCDDPALGLDVVMRRELLDALIDLLADTGCAVLFSSHFLPDVERIADRIGVLHDGALVADATLDDLKRRVRRCTWVPREGQLQAAVPWLLRASPRRTGFELFTLDAPEAAWQTLRALGELAPPEVPTLEELFVALVSMERPRLLQEPGTDAMASLATVGGAR